MHKTNFDIVSFILIFLSFIMAIYFFKKKLFYKTVNSTRAINHEAIFYWGHNAFFMWAVRARKIRCTLVPGAYRPPKVESRATK